VSGHHAEIRRARSGYFIRDLGSTNGTFINGKRIESEQRLRPGDEVRFGAARFAMVAGAKRSSSVAKVVGSVFGLILIAAIGFLSFQFVINWENLEKLGLTTPQPAASVTANATLAAAPSAASSSAAPPIAEAKPEVPPPWLAAINDYRAAGNLPPVADDPKLSDADRKHAMYVVKNYADKVSFGHLIGAEMHEEDKGNPWFTPEARDAGAHSDVNQLWGYASPPSPMWALDNWISGPFHRLWILNPRLRRVGYGEFCEQKYCVAALDLGTGIEAASSAAPLAAPVEFPADKSITTLNSFSNEWPTPLTACAGFAYPAGLPVTIELGANVDAKLSDYQITRDGHGMEACGIDAATYQNPVSAEQERGREVLRDLGAAVIIPRYPLHPGRYAVSATVNDHAYQWTFVVAAASGETANENAPAAPAQASSKPSSKDEFEAALRRAYASLSKGESENRSEYDTEAKRQQAADAASKAARAAKAELVLAKNRELQRRGESAFIEGPGAVAPAGPQQWLAELNRYRAAADLPPVTEDRTFSDGDFKHAKYIATNYPTRPAIATLPSTEDATKPGYTLEGAEAAPYSEVLPFWYPPTGPAPASLSALLFLNSWLAGPFHRAELLSPELHTVGFGEFCLDHACAAALNVSEVVKAVAMPVTFSNAILFPPAKYPIALVDLLTEFPSPLSSCSGYAMPVGLPVTIQLGRDLDAKLSSYSIRQASKSVEACGFDSVSYSSSNASEQERTRKWLHSFGEVVIVPRKPLTRGASYDVSATVNGQPFNWSFTVSK
jgi:uncharacterized protein YkwD